MKQAKELARAYRAFDGQVTFYMLPWNTIMVGVNLDKMEELLEKPVKDFDHFQRFFPIAEALTVDIEFVDNLTPELQGLQAYWQGRNGDIAANFTCFQSYLSNEVFGQWVTAYGMTRDRSLESSVSLEKPAEDADEAKKKPMSRRLPNKKRTGGT